MSAPYGRKARKRDGPTPVPLKGKARFNAENRVIAKAQGVAQTGLVLALLRYAAGKPDCWPSNGTLARTLNIDERYVRKILSELARAGVVTLLKDGTVRTGRRIIFNDFGAADIRGGGGDDDEPF